MPPHARFERASGPRPVGTADRCPARSTMPSDVPLSAIAEAARGASRARSAAPPCCVCRSNGAAGLREVREPAGGRRLQDPAAPPTSSRGSTPTRAARRHHLLVGQPRPGGGDGRPPGRRARGGRHADHRSRVKVEGARALGAEILFEGTTSIERKRRAEAVARDRDLQMVPPFDHPWIIAGQGTVGLEIVEDCPEVARILVPVGAGAWRPASPPPSSSGVPRYGWSGSSRPARPR